MNHNMRRLVIIWIMMLTSILRLAVVILLVWIVMLLNDDMFRLVTIVMLLNDNNITAWFELDNQENTNSADQKTNDDSHNIATFIYCSNTGLSAVSISTSDSGVIDRSLSILGIVSSLFNLSSFV